MKKFGKAVKGIVLSSTILLAFVVVMIFFCDLSILSSLPRQSNLIFNATKQIRSIASAAVSMRNYSSSAASTSTSKKDSILISNQTALNKFDQRIREFITKDSCKSHFFFTRLLPAPLFQNRDMMAVESLFKTNPDACLVILSDVMESKQGQDILTPITSKGYSILTITPDFPFLVTNTPAFHWYNDLQKGNINTGKIPISQNLSNLLRYLALYKYGGVYVDTDFIILNSFTNLTNTVGFESYNPKTGKFVLINNAALIFDQGHPLVRRFLEEFAATFDGDKWGNQGPHLVTRVIDRVEKVNGGMWVEGYNFTVLPPAVFYPVTWQDAGEIFRKPDGPEQTKRVEAQTALINEKSYGLHLWNKLTKRMKVQEGSIISRLYAGHCIICRDFQDLN